MRVACGVLAGTVGLLAWNAALHPAGAAEPASPTIMRMVETDLDGDAHPVASGRAVIDLNSAIRIDIDKGAVARAVAPTSGTATAALVSDYSTFQTAVARITPALTALNATMQTLTARWPNDPTKRRQELASAIHPIADVLTPLTDYAQGTPADPAAQVRRLTFLKALKSVVGSIRPGTSILDQDTSLFRAVQTELQRLQGELTGALQKEGINLVMGAWLGTASGTTPVNIPNFDNYPALPRTEIDRFKVVFTADQKQQYENARTAAGMINAGQAAEAARQVLAALIDQYFTPTLTSLTALRAATQTFRQVAQSSATAVFADVSALDDLIAADVVWLQQTIATLRNILSSNPSGLLAAVQQDWSELKTRAQAVEQSVQALAQRVAQAANDVRTAAATVDMAVQNVKMSVSGDVAGLETAISRAMNGVQLDTATLAFGEQIRRFTLDALPVTATLDVTRTGSRSEGDELVVKFGIERPNAPTVDAEVQSLVLRRLMLHVQTAAGLVFATRPRLPSDGDKKVPFQAAPAYSAFLKKGWRGSPFWNNLLTPGLGINVAALDFDLDGVPEIGVGAAVSILRDWLQGGAGYNLFQRKWYGFVGIGLPLPTFGMVTSSGESKAAGATTSTK